MPRETGSNCRKHRNLSEVRRLISLFCVAERQRPNSTTEYPIQHRLLEFPRLEELLFLSGTSPAGKEMSKSRATTGPKSLSTTPSSVPRMDPQVG